MSAEQPDRSYEPVENPIESNQKSCPSDRGACGVDNNITFCDDAFFVEEDCNNPLSDAEIGRQVKAQMEAKYRGSVSVRSCDGSQTLSTSVSSETRASSFPQDDEDCTINKANWTEEDHLNNFINQRFAGNDKVSARDYDQAVADYYKMTGNNVAQKQETNNAGGTFQFIETDEEVQDDRTQAEKDKGYSVAQAHLMRERGDATIQMAKEAGMGTQYMQQEAIKNGGVAVKETRFFRAVDGEKLQAKLDQDEWVGQYMKNEAKQEQASATTETPSVSTESSTSAESTPNINKAEKSESSAKADFIKDYLGERADDGISGSEYREAMKAYKEKEAERAEEKQKADFIKDYLGSDTEDGISEAEYAEAAQAYQEMKDFGLEMESKKA